jgi:hypothetical protein
MHYERRTAEPKMDEDPATIQQERSDCTNSMLAMQTLVFTASIVALAASSDVPHHIRRPPAVLRGNREL